MLVYVINDVVMFVYFCSYSFCLELVQHYSISVDLDIMLFNFAKTKTHLFRYFMTTEAWSILFKRSKLLLCSSFVILKLLFVMIILKSVYIYNTCTRIKKYQIDKQ